MYDEIITLLGQEKYINVPGQGRKKKQEERQIFVKVCSIGQQEFYQAQSTGLKPEIKFILSDYLNYNNEKELIYNNIKYQVLRTYRQNKELEITCYGGINYEREDVAIIDKTAKFDKSCFDTPERIDYYATS